MINTRRWYLIGGGVLVTALLLLALMAEQVAPLSPYYMNASYDLLAPKPPFPPGPLHRLGTDEWGRDILSRIAFGARLSLLFALLIMSCRLLVAIPAALMATFGPRWARWLLGQLYVATSALPPLLIYIFILSVPRLRLIGFWPSVLLTLGLVTLVEFPRLAVVLRNRLEELAAEEFVEGAVAAGATRWRILAVHMLPHLWPTLLHMVAGEMGRGLLTIAQMGIFGIWVGGGAMESMPMGDRMVQVMIPGVPEWGTMLASARKWIRIAPWVPLAPAAAFFAGVVGFHLLSQGLEGLNISPGKLREMTTGRLSARWRLTLLPLAAAAVLWYVQGLPWGREAGIAALAATQQAALSAGDMDALVATIAPSDPDYLREQRRALSRLVERPGATVAVTPGLVTVSGARAAAEWNITVQYPGEVPNTHSRTVALVRRWGRWYETRSGYTLFPGLHIDLEANYSPNDPRDSAMGRRKDVRLLAKASDWAYEQIQPLFPDERGGRPRLRLYQSPWEFLEASDKGGATTTSDRYALSFGEALRVSPHFAAGLDPEEVHEAVGYELLKYMTHLRLGRETAHPVVTGLFQQSLPPRYKLGYVTWENAELLGLPELFEVPLERLSPARQAAYTAQSALLIDLLAQKVSLADLQRSPSRLSSPAELAQFVGMSAADLTAAYDRYVAERVAGLTLLLDPLWRADIPMALTDAVDARAARVRAELGLETYETKTLDVQLRGSTAKVRVLERVIRPGESPRMVVTMQHWAIRDGEWVCFQSDSPILAGQVAEADGAATEELVPVPALGKSVPLALARRLERFVSQLEAAGYPIPPGRAIYAEGDPTGKGHRGLVLAWQTADNGAMAAFMMDGGQPVAASLGDVLYPTPEQVGVIAVGGRSFLAVVTDRESPGPGAEVILLSYDQASASLERTLYRTADAAGLQPTTFFTATLLVPAGNGGDYEAQYWIMVGSTGEWIKGPTAPYKR